MSSQSYAISGPDVVSEEFDGDLVVLNLLSGQYCGMNPIGALIWTALLQGTPSAQIAAAHAQPKAVEAYVQRLVDLVLLAPTDTQGPDLSDDQKADIAALTDAPIIDVYDDLSDLLIADPIHDVDEEAGWPKRPTDA